MPNFFAKEVLAWSTLVCEVLQNDPLEIMCDLQLCNQRGHFQKAGTLQYSNVDQCQHPWISTNDIISYESVLHIDTRVIPIDSNMIYRWSFANDRVQVCVSRIAFLHRVLFQAVRVWFLRQIAAKSEDHAAMFRLKDPVDQIFQEKTSLLFPNMLQSLFCSYRTSTMS